MWQESKKGFTRPAKRGNPKSQIHCCKGLRSSTHWIHLTCGIPMRSGNSNRDVHPHPIRSCFWFMPPKEPWKGQMRIHLFRCPEIYIEQGLFRIYPQITIDARVSMLGCHVAGRSAAPTSEDRLFSVRTEEWSVSVGSVDDRHQRVASRMDLTVRCCF